MPSAPTQTASPPIDPLEANDADFAAGFDKLYAQTWDEGPVVGTNVFLEAPGKSGIAEAARELTTVAATEQYEGKPQNWTAILDGELAKAREIQNDFSGLRYREVEQAYARRVGFWPAHHIIALRRDAFDEFPEGERLRDLAREIKEATLQHLDRYVEQLIDSVERLGGHVHYATTPEEARRVVLDIAARTGARMAVKSKSMASEEIHLNEALEAAGVIPIETDLGEYIIQLAHERPSHIIAPAIHKTKGQVADLFAKELKREVAADPEELTRIARVELRQKFLEADLGITGANFAVADTGTVVLVTNEGNGRMVTSLPRVHVAVMGVEKVVPSMTDLMVFLRSSPRARRARSSRSTPRSSAGRAGPASSRDPTSFTWCCWTTAASARSRGRSARRSTACAAAPASTSVPSTGRSAATPTATRIPGRSASS